MESRMHLLVRSRGRLCALPLEKVVEVTRALGLEPLPRSPDFVLGLCRVRGEDLPVLDLGKLLGLTDPPGATRFVVTGSSGRRMILAVEATESIEPLDPDRVKEMPTIAQQVDEELIGWISRRDRELLWILNAARVLERGLEGVRGEG